MKIKYLEYSNILKCLSTVNKQRLVHYFAPIGKWR